MARSGRGRRNSRFQLAYIRRRASLLKTANEICSATGSRMIFIEQHPDSTVRVTETGRNEEMEELKRRYADLKGQIKEEKKREAQLEEEAKAMKEQGLWGKEMDDDDEFDIDQLKDAIAKVEEWKKKLQAGGNGAGVGDGGVQ